MRRFIAALLPTFRYWMQTEVHVYSFSVAANVLLSFYPFLIVLMGVSRLVFNEAATLAAIQLALRDYFPSSFTDFLYTKGAHENLPLSKPTEIIAVILLLFTANGIFEPLEVALNRVWRIGKNRSFVANQIVSLGLIFVCGALAILSLMMTAFNHQSLANMTANSHWVPVWLYAWIPILIFKLAALPLTVLVLFLVYRFLPNGKPPLARVIPAAIVTGILLEFLKYMSKLIWPWLAVKLEREYAVFRYSVTLILLGFFVSMLVLAGAEWASRNQSLDGGEKTHA